MASLCWCCPYPRWALLTLVANDIFSKVQSAEKAIISLSAEIFVGGKPCFTFFRWGKGPKMAAAIVYYD